MTMQPVSLAAISCSIFEDLLRDYTHELTQRIHRMSKLALQKCQRCNTYCRQHCTKPGFDIYANNIQTPSSIPYYQCLSCRREIAASRYAAHMEKCKGRSLSSATSYASLLDGDNSNDED
ncbi:SAGA complex subunit Sgf11 [Schizosaccharomyces cryophilus OY26]|uniref:SAGA-associated factor 11 n=1 Tax=Schizosaccharomyces cryophilus (strain OY26 / ATCC MYA-4695 / CBS 11777 / NBRC 106824 / NRRL Y48691) TaxID=653667 RepID=S9VXK7_SCHCR|nr:SAGA complex subunit Sgf11 [Schizosaccharomyces cryophilus OY26]EPY50929.1 SAGA complex subunit Sgf11 [Schizosaccharomyces cryophilus OY26]